MSLKTLEASFKPEVRSAGQQFLTKERVSASRPSDLQIQGYVRTSTSFKVSLKLPTMDSTTIYASCSCPLSAKGQLCKHIWAVLLAVDQKFEDFLEDKKEVNAEAAAKSTTTEGPDHKTKQAEYRKQQYAQQKLRLKEQKKAKKTASTLPAYPEDVSAAVDYFLANGFPFQNPLQADEVRQAKKKLSRVFHPDIGGSHEESVQLNRQADLLIAYIEML